VSGEISRKHGNTRVSTLRKIYGSGFAAGHGETETLDEVLSDLHEASLSQLIREHASGILAGSIASHESALAKLAGAFCPRQWGNLP
jgi:hypothetical protein